MTATTFHTIVRDLMNFHEDRTASFRIVTKNGRIYETSADAYTQITADCIAFSDDDSMYYIPFEEMAEIES